MNWAVIAGIGAGISVGFCMGSLFGVWFAGIAQERAQRFYRTGRVSEPAPSTTRIPGGEFRMDPQSSGMPPSLNAEESQAAYDRIVNRGADALMDMEPSLSRAGAIEKAKRALDETGSFVMGGIPSA